MARLRSPLGSWWLALLLVVFWVPDAHAHLPLPGANEILGGVLHPFVTPAHLLVLLGLGLLLGQRLKRYFNSLPMAFAPAAAIALALTPLHWIATVPVPVFVGLALVIGSLVALDRDLPLAAIVVLVVTAAVAIGLDSGLDPGSAGSTAKTLIGTWIGLFVGLANLAYYSSLAAESGRKWLSIALRVAGSWIVAISLLMLAFSLRK